VKSYRFTPLAEADLVEIVDFIVEHGGADRADHVLSDILQAVERLATKPGIGHARPDLTDEPVQFWSVRGFLIIYRRRSKPLEIVRVLSGWRDISALLGKRRDRG
jgi:plasmid stabilization system protein ParE